MSDEFKAWVIRKTEGGQDVSFTTFSTDDLLEGSVTVSVAHSTINYKDGLALTGAAPIARIDPLIPGIDFAGEVTQSSDSTYKVGDKVVLNGWGVGEGHHGGLAEVARVPGEYLVPLPEGMSTFDAMAIGTAGYTAMLCIMALEDSGLTPDSGEVLVTGAAGGVGTVAVSILSDLGYHVVASSGRPEEAGFLKDLGAAEIIDRNEFSGKLRPLARARWAGAVDVVGSETLAHVLSQMKDEAPVAACGLAQGMDLPTSVAPFILRGVKLLGVNSVTCPFEKRMTAWQRLTKELDPKKLSSLTTSVPLSDARQVADDIIAGKVRGRVVVEI